jgi:hypothetical protein
MRLWRVCSLVVGLGILLMLVSCSSEVTKNDTETFLLGLSTMFTEAMTDETAQIMIDFQGSAPPGPELPDPTEVLGSASAKKLRAPDPLGLDTLYGTWHLYPLQGWQHVDPDDPENAVLFEWEYVDTSMVEHDAYVLLDSLAFYEDSLPTNIWVGVGMDDDLLAWLKLEAAYLSLEEVNELSLIFEIIDNFQVGVSISSAAAIDTIFTGTVRLWAIDWISRDDYRVDLVVDMYESYPEEIELSDSRGWEMDVSFSEVVETDVVEDVVYERRNVSGEITKDGNHAADISGYVWDPEGGTHISEIVVTFSDGTEGDLANYMNPDDLGY